MRNKRQELAKSLSSLAMAVTVLMCFRWLLVEPYVIPSGSMMPSLLIHDHILVYKSAFGFRFPISKSWVGKPKLPERGDVVVFRSVEDDGFFLIKRVIGLPGDKLTYSRGGQILINGQEISRVAYPEDTEHRFYAANSTDLQGERADFDFFMEKNGTHTYRTMLRKDHQLWDDDLTYKVPEGELFMMGDNRDNSKDSRYWGTLPVENLLGKALFIWLSCEKTFESAPFLCNPLTLRWKRFFQKID